MQTPSEIDAADAHAPAGARPAGKVETPRGAVNFVIPWRARRVRLAPLALLALVVLAGCGRPVRSLPVRTVEPAWPTLLGSTARTAGSADVVLRDELEEVWRAELGPGLYSPVIVAGGFVIAATGGRTTVVVDAETGQHYWERRLEAALTGGLVHDRQAIYVVGDARDGRAYALGVQRGQRHWARRVDGSGFAPLLVGDTLFVASHAGQLRALAGADGRELWRAPLGAPPRSTPVPFEQYVAVPIARDSLLLLARSTGRVEARAALPANVSGPPALAGDTLLLPLENGELLGVRLPSLDVVTRAALGAPILAAPVVAPDGTWYVLTRSADVWRIRPHTREAERIAELGGAARASLALARDRLVVGRLDGTLFLLDLDGAIIWQRRFRDAIHAPVAVAGGAVYLPLLRGDLVKLR
jgi:outer membrane protein assembly factor BamB